MLEMLFSIKIEKTVANMVAVFLLLVCQLGTHLSILTFFNKNNY